jgi:polyhydroxybutyrate depolymerase
MTCFALAGLARAQAMLALTMMLGSFIPAAAAADVEHSLRHQDQVRSYLLHLPETAEPGGSKADRSERLPLVMVLHGGGGNAANAARMSGMSAIADRENFLVVYPNGSGRLRRAMLTWNAGNCCGKALDDQVDDVGFLNAVIDDVAQRHRIDPRRVYVTGLSNGGMMAYRLGCETPDRFAAIAPVAGAMNVECRPSVPLSVIAFHGTADEHVPYAGGAPTTSVDRHPRVDTPVQETIAFWTKFNACRASSTETVAEVRTDTMTNCTDGTEVQLNTLKDFGHAWPGGEKGSRRGDDPTASINASEVMWKFFERHSR